eukprot:3319167-Rhodomonas_salina.2
MPRPDQLRSTPAPNPHTERYFAAAPWYHHLTLRQAETQHTTQGARFEIEHSGTRVWRCNVVSGARGFWHGKGGFWCLVSGSEEHQQARRRDQMQATTFLGHNVRRLRRLVSVSGAIDTFFAEHPAAVRHLGAHQLRQRWTPHSADARGLGAQTHWRTTAGLKQMTRMTLEIRHKRPHVWANSHWKITSGLSGSTQSSHMSC